jgi:hypothetical protein|tara:strand:- start:858 stop:1079 length:222 start_codon:yes stop_codon:yes gene_type:complete
MTRIRFTDISPDGVRIVVDWEKFVPGASVFIPAINTGKAVQHVTEASHFTKKDITYRVCIENGRYGVRVWRLK